MDDIERDLPSEYSCVDGNANSKEESVDHGAAFYFVFLFSWRVRENWTKTKKE